MLNIFFFRRHQFLVVSHSTCPKKYQLQLGQIDIRKLGGGGRPFFHDAMHEDDDEGEEATTPLKYSPYLPRPSAVTKSALAPSSTISAGIPRMAYLVDSASLIRNPCKFENGTDSHGMHPR
jgi:hypothetical protein